MRCPVSCNATKGAQEKVCRFLVLFVFSLVVLRFVFCGLVRFSLWVLLVVVVRELLCYVPHACGPASCHWVDDIRAVLTTNCICL